MQDPSVIDTYDALSATYDSSPNPLLPIEALPVKSLLRTIDFEDVLDAATGTGRYAIYLAELGKRVTAVDASPGMLAVARAKADKAILPIRFLEEKLDALSLPDAS